MERLHLQYFVAVAEDLIFRRAAHCLYLSHPSLSQQITDLEDELGMKLFRRNSRRVRLSEAGRVFLARVKTPAPELMLMIRPLLLFLKCGTMARITSITPKTPAELSSRINLSGEPRSVVTEREQIPPLLLF
jgi:hypothetical protein